MALSIRAFALGRALGLRKSAFTYLRGDDQTIDIPLIMFMIEGGEYPIVVDTGGDPSRARDLHGIRLEQARDEEPLAVLHRAGVDPGDVRLVVNTHLHWDHSSNNHLFPQAQIVVQRRELDFARRPVTWHNAQFEVGPGVTAAWRAAEERVRTVEGDTELAPGVSVVSLEGHTPGSQGVLVEAAGGRYLIAGDAVYLYENWEGDERAAHIPAGLYTNLEEYEKSFSKIEGLGCEVIPSHEFKVVERAVFD
jgi:N-acyl homoserine lactone hydrolase